MKRKGVLHTSTAPLGQFFLGPVFPDAVTVVHIMHGVPPRCISREVILSGHCGLRCFMTMVWPMAAEGAFCWDKSSWSQAVSEESELPITSHHWRRHDEEKRKTNSFFLWANVDFKEKNAKHKQRKGEIYLKRNPPGNVPGFIFTAAYSPIVIINNICNPMIPDV